MQCGPESRRPWSSVAGRSRDVIAVVPDAAVRVVLLDFELFRRIREEAEGVVRFRLKKSLPFDVDKAKVSYHAQKSAQWSARCRGGGPDQRDRRLRIAFPRGRIQSGSGAALDAGGSGSSRCRSPTLVVKVDARTIGIAILKMSSSNCSAPSKIRAA